MAIVLRTRPAIGIREGTFDAPAGPKWFTAGQEPVERALNSVGRIEIEGHPVLSWIGVGVRVGPDCFLTARHAASLFAKGSGDHDLQMDPALRVFLTTGAQFGQRVESRVPVKAVRFLHPFFDVALCQLETGSPEHLRLASAMPDPLENRRVAVLGFATADPRNEAAVVQEVYGQIGAELYVQPGEIRGLRRQTLGADSPPAIAHDCSTLGGSAGAPLLDLDTGIVLGIHVAGQYLKENFAVPVWELARDPRVRKHGVQFELPPWYSRWSEEPAEAEEEDEEPAVRRELPWFGYFTQDEMYEIRDLIVAGGLARNAQSSDRLLTAMDDTFRSGLGTYENIGDRILGWLAECNRVPKLVDGSIPMRVLMVNAVQATRVLQQGVKLKAFLKELDRQITGLA
jgi:hypothetical protein